MRTNSWIFIIMLTLAVAAEAQVRTEAPAIKRWDVSVTAAASEVKPNPNSQRHWDDWFFQGRCAVAIGSYWTEHLKTEIEYARVGEGSTLVQDFKPVPGSPYPYPFMSESFHNIDQLSLKMTWQFAENSWVHPYVSAGLVGERDRERCHTPPQYYSPTGRITDQVVVVPEFTSPALDRYRGGVVGAAGAKLYFSRNAFVNAGVNMTYANPSHTINMFAGIGIDF